MKRTLIYVLLLLMGSLNLHAQIQDPSKWSYSTDPKTAKAGEEVELIFTAKIQTDWYLYSSDFDPELGPMVTTFTFEQNDSYELLGGIIPVDPKKKFDKEIWNGEYTYFKKEGKFIQKVKILKDNPNIKGVVEGQVCSDESGQCIPFEKDFSFKLSGATTKKAVKKTPDVIKVSGEEENESLLGFMLVAFLAGLAALLTPCVFPMIPMTVTFFTGGAKTKREARTKALVYGFSIIGIYVLAGTAVAVLFGAEFANWLSTHWAPNLFFFLVFMIFALSFLGMFEITLPSKFVNNVDKQADKGGYYGVFFMAFTIVLVSFSCTGPIVGTILVESAGGQFIKPILGMFSFALAFAIPFTLFAIFPQWLSSLPKSGGWLNSVKVTLGFIELALGLKFLSVADQVYHWRLLDREIYLALWIVIFTLLGIYLLGKLRMPHDSPMEKTPVPRLILAIVSFAFVVYLIPGMWGAPLKGLSGYLPPITTQDFNLQNYQGGGGNNTEGNSGEICDTPKYSDFLHLPHGIHGYFDYEQALACAKEQGKPLFIDFTGHGCVNCREMEARVWSDPKVLEILKNDYVVVALYVDDKKELPESDWYTSKYDNKVKKSIGKQNADFQITRFNNNAQPYYCLLNSQGELMIKPKAYDLKINNFVDFLKKGIEEYKKNP